MALSENDPRVKALKERLENYKAGDTQLKESSIETEPKSIPALKVPEVFVAQVNDPMAAIRAQQALDMENTGWDIYADLYERRAKELEEPEEPEELLPEPKLIPTKKPKKEAIRQVNGRNVDKETIKYAKKFNEIVKKYKGNYQDMMRRGTPEERRIIAMFANDVKKDVKKQVKNMGYSGERADQVVNAFMDEGAANAILYNKIGSANYVTPREAQEKAYEDHLKTTKEFEQNHNGTTLGEALNNSRNIVNGYAQRRQNIRDLDGMMAATIAAPAAGVLAPIAAVAPWLNAGQDAVIRNNSRYGLTLDNNYQLAQNGYSGWNDKMVNKYGLNPIIADMTRVGNIPLTAAGIAGLGNAAITTARNFGRSVANATKGSLGGADIPVLKTIGDYSHDVARGASAEELAATRAGMSNYGKVQASGYAGPVEFTPTNTHLRTYGFGAGGYKGVPGGSRGLDVSMQLPSHLWVGHNSSINPGNGRAFGYEMYRGLDPISTNGLGQGVAYGVAQGLNHSNNK